MKVLAINCGSSTLKFDLIATSSRTGGPEDGGRLASGAVERIGGRAKLRFTTGGREKSSEEAVISDHGEATRRVLDWLDSLGLLREDVEAVGHRVVHGGDRFLEPAAIDEQAIRAIESLTALAPLHNLPSLEAIKASRAALGSMVPMVAVFDTTFHRTMPDRASQYAIPPDLAEKYSIRRYGFHGLAHRYMAERYAATASVPLDRMRLITLQLGNGCSGTAIEAGRSVDTSMGFTPLEGLMMGTRSGDVDPSLAGFLSQQEGVAVSEVEGWLNTRSGLLGVSGRSRDMRELLEAEEQGDRRASLAVTMFCYRVRKCIGAYLAVLGGAEAVIFGGGIGESAPSVRARICQGMEWCGLSLDEERNAAVNPEGRISGDGAGIQAHVVSVDEASIIAADTAQALAG